MVADIVTDVEGKDKNTTQQLLKLREQVDAQVLLEPAVTSLTSVQSTK